MHDHNDNDDDDFVDDVLNAADLDMTPDLDI